VSLRLSLIACLILSSCAFFSNKKGPDLTYAAISGDGIGNQSALELTLILKRSISMAGGNYSVSAHPITHTLLKARANEIAIARGFTPEQEKQLLDHDTAEYLDGKICFDFTYLATRFPQVAQLSDWKISLQDNQKEDYPLTWRADDLAHPAIVSKKTTSEGVMDEWLGHGIACARSYVDISQQFGLVVTPKFVQWPFATSETILWEFDHYIEKDGEKVLQKKTNQNFQPYRGW
jgi:hypothetical protein